MTIALTKKKLLVTETPVAVTASPVEAQKILAKASLENLVDQYGALAEEVDKLLSDVRIATLENLKAQILLDADVVYHPEEKATVKGKTYSLDITAKKKSTSITEGKIELIQKFLTKPVFFQLCKVGITDLKKYLSKPQLDQVIEENFTGARSLKCKKEV